MRHLKKSQCQGHAPDQLNQNLWELDPSPEKVYKDSNAQPRETTTWSEDVGLEIYTNNLKDYRDLNMFNCGWERSRREGREDTGACRKYRIVEERKASGSSDLKGMYYALNYTVGYLDIFKTYFNPHFFSYPKSRVKLPFESFPMEDNAVKPFLLFHKRFSFS